MGLLLSQLGLLAQRGRDTDEWVNVLFVVVVAVLYAVGALIKGVSAKGQKRQGQSPPTQGQRETWQQRLVRKAQEVQRAAEAGTKQAAAGMRRLAEETGEQKAKSSPTGARPGSPRQGRLSTRPGRGGQSILVYEQGSPEAASERQQRAARLRRARELAAEQKRPRQPQPAVTPRRPEEPSAIEPIAEVIDDMGLEPARPLTRAQRQPAKVPALPIIDYTDPDALKKAILHYEILGKPLALRDPFQRTADL